MRKIIFAFFVAFTFLFTSTTNIYAKDLVMEENTNIYYAMYNSSFYRSYSFFRYFQDGRRVYCIDPDHKVTKSSYTDVKDITILSKETLDKISLIGYFGTDYPGHNTLDYELATQALIWEEIKGVTVKWFTERYSYGTEIDVSKQREEILRLIKEYKITPSLEQTNVKGISGDKISISDKNNVLNEYEIVSFSGGQASIQNNSLILNLTNTPGNYDLVLRRKRYSNDTTTYFVADNSQTMMQGRAKEQTFKINVEVVSGFLEVTKLGVSLKGEKTPLSNVTFELRARQNFYYQDGNLRWGQDELIGVYKTDENGVFKESLPYGEYYLLELETNSNYFLEPTFYNVTISEEKTFLTIENEEKYATLTLLKKDKDTLENIDEVTFSIKNLSTNETFLRKTEGGKISITLPLGTYEVKEMETIPNYVLGKEGKILELKEHKEEVEYTFYNEKKKGTLIIYKKDKDTLENLDGVTFEVQDLNTGEVHILKTKDGKCSLTLPVGIYKVKEIEAISNYILNEEIKILELKEQEEKIEYTFYNEKIPEIPDTGIHDSSSFYSLLAIFFLLGKLKKEKQI